LAIAIGECQSAQYYASEDIMTHENSFMTGKPLHDEDDFAHSSVTTKVDVVDNSSVNRALIAMAQEVAELLTQAYPTQADSSDCPPGSGKADRTLYNCHSSQNNIESFDSEI
jgi:hypothetical protein